MAAGNSGLSREVSAARLIAEIKPRVEAEIQRLQASGARLDMKDIRTVAAGKAIEVLSRYYPAVIVDEDGSAMSIEKFLAKILSSAEELLVSD